MKEDISLHNARVCTPRQGLYIRSQRRGLDSLAVFEDKVFVNRVEGLEHLVDASLHFRICVDNILTPVFGWE
jgi:hypothetical protein